MNCQRVLYATTITSSQVCVSAPCTALLPHISRAQKTYHRRKCGTSSQFSDCVVYTSGHASRLSRAKLKMPSA